MTDGLTEMALELPLTDVDISEDIFEGDEPGDVAFTSQRVGSEDVSLMMDSMENTIVHLTESSGTNLGNDEAIAKAWKHEMDSMCTEINVSQTDKRNLTKAKVLCGRTLHAAKKVLAIEGNLTVRDSLNLFLNRDWYFLVEKYVNTQATASNVKKFTVSEVMEVFRVWILQMLEKQTAETLFLNRGHRWGYTTHLKVSKIRYKEFMKCLDGGGNALHEDILGTTEEETENENVWGNLLQVEELPRKLEEYVGSVGKYFVFDGISDVTIDDDKLRHSSRKFREMGLQMTGFRGCRIGPVMNGLASVHTGILHAIHFNRHGDNPVSVTSSLLQNIGYGSANVLKKKLDVLVMIDRGYNYKGVTDFLSRLGTRFLGTHSEKFDSWPFSTSESPQKNQKKIAADGARTVYTAKKVKGERPIWAHCYRNGGKLVGNILTTEALVGQWEIKQKKKSQFTFPQFESITSSVLHSMWLQNTVEMTVDQAVAPWFELRCGALTGTTTKNALRCIKFELLDNDGTSDACRNVFQVLGVQLQRPTQADLDKKSIAKKKKAYQQLGFSGNPTKAILDETLLKHHPSPSLVFQKFIRTWCMSPIKRKGVSQLDAFCQGQAAEPLIHRSIKKFFTAYVHDARIEDLWTTGLVRRKQDLVCAASPDAMGILSVSVTVNALQNGKLQSFLSTLLSNNNHTIQPLCILEDGRYHVVVSIEYKHKSSVATIAKAQDIQSTLQSNFVILDLGDPTDQDEFKRCIPELDFRFQVIHEAFCTTTYVTVFTVASTKIEYAVIILFPPELLKEYGLCADFLKSKHLRWMFDPDDINKFDSKLTQMPSFGNISYGYASDTQTLKCRLQLMMCLHKLRNESGKAIPQGSGLIPTSVALWNSLKGAIDDLSKVLAHNLAKWGAISPATVLVLRVFSSQLYSAWRVYSLQCVHEYLAQKCLKYQSFLDERHRKGGSFENFLDMTFHSLSLPYDLPGVNHTVATTDYIASAPMKPQGKLAGRSRFNSDEWKSFRIGGTKRVGNDKHYLVCLSECYRSQRSFCAFCTKSAYIPEDRKGTSMCLYTGGPGRKPSFGCNKYEVPLCKKSPDKTGISCFEKWHSNQKIRVGNDVNKLSKKRYPTRKKTEPPCIANQAHGSTEKETMKRTQGTHSIVNTDSNKPDKRKKGPPAMRATDLANAAKREKNKLEQESTNSPSIANRKVTPETVTTSSSKDAKRKKGTPGKETKDLPKVTNRRGTPGKPRPCIAKRTWCNAPNTATTDPGQTVKMTGRSLREVTRDFSNAANRKNSTPEKRKTISPSTTKRKGTHEAATACSLKAAKKRKRCC